MRFDRWFQVVLVGGLSFAATTSFQRVLRAAPANAPARASMVAPASVPVSAAVSEPARAAVNVSKAVPRGEAGCRPVRVVYPGLVGAPEGCRRS